MIKIFLSSLLFFVNLSALQLSNTNLENVSDNDFFKSNFDFMCLQNIPQNFVYESNDKTLIKLKSTTSSEWGESNLEYGFLINNDKLKQNHTIVRYPDEQLGDLFYKDPILYYNIEDKFAILNVNLIKGNFQSQKIHNNPNTLTNIELKNLEKVIIYFSSRFGFELENIVICGEFNLDYDKIKIMINKDYNISNLEEGETSHIITIGKSINISHKDKRDDKYFSIYSLIDFYYNIEK